MSLFNAFAKLKVKTKLVLGFSFVPGSVSIR